MGASLRWTSPPSRILLLSICLLGLDVKAVFFPDQNLSFLGEQEYELYNKARFGTHQIVNMLFCTRR
jgi:hypothetical protein